ncbi:DUF3244 domain-containing protein [uncultured Bacteroides sp.]|uniref:DUF3244 domain-containing protein n=1 Tax=uncultured Bacteroides sp. TaxID=162156 RepID=UPI0025F0B1B3|nr:DUF3244 domain-containing protein [uncultured Bacteroides sp.]
MKRLFLLIISLLFYINCIAQETFIQLYHKDPSSRGKDKRSLSIELMVTHDGDIIHIHSNIPICKLQIIVKDTKGNTIYTNETVSTLQDFAYELNMLEENYYFLEITIGEESFYGYFSTK